jgi:hypothetical protein
MMMAEEDRADGFLEAVLIGSYFWELVMEDDVYMTIKSDSLDDEAD